MSYMMFDLNESDEVKAEYEEFLRLNAVGVFRSAQQLLRALQLMSAPAEEYRHGVAFTLARHVAEEVDAVSALLEKGCVDPCKPHLRSAFEADIGIRYMFQEDSERRAVAYHVQEARDRLATNEKYDVRTEAGLRANLGDDTLGIELLDQLPDYDFDLQRMLSEAPFDEVNQEWNGKPKPKRARWYSPDNVRELAIAWIEGRGTNSSIRIGRGACTQAERFVTWGLTAKIRNGVAMPFARFATRRGSRWSITSPHWVSDLV